MHQCQCCQTYKQAQYCSTCIQEGIASNRTFADNLRSQASTLVHSASFEQQSRGVAAWRTLRAQVAAKEAKCSRLASRIQALQAELAQIPRTLAASPRLELDPRKRRIGAIAQTQAECLDISHRITHARRVLVGEAANIFGIENIEQVWRIAGVPLAEPARSRHSDTMMTNAALSHTIHLLSLVSRYLSITLPYPVSWRQTHVGRPTIRANMPFLNTTKFRDRYVLWLSNSRQGAKANEKYRHFLTAFALFAHSIGYLAWSQGVEGIGVDGPGVRISVTSILQLLDETTRAVHLGVRAHEPGTSLLNHLGFSLNVLQVVESVTGPEEDQGWDMVDASTI